MPKETIAELKQRIKELEAENSELKTEVERLRLIAISIGLMSKYNAEEGEH